jgi:hypothetical protein
MNELFKYGEQTGTKVISAQYEYDQMIEYIQEIKFRALKDTDDEITKAMKRKYGEHSE